MIFNLLFSIARSRDRDFDLDLLWLEFDSVEKKSALFSTHVSIPHNCLVTLDRDYLRMEDWDTIMSLLRLAVSYTQWISPQAVLKNGSRILLLPLACLGEREPR